MSFNSLEYIVLVVIAFALYWAFARMPKAQNIVLAVSGIAFIGWVDWRMAVPVIVLGLLTYIAAILLDNQSLHRFTKRIMIWSTTSVCIGALAYYKYCNFFINSFASVLHALGLHVHFNTINIILPLGISFYTFQTLGYVVDVYTGRHRATRDIISYMAFVLFFPKLLAGPIERASNLLDQLILPRRFDYGIAVDGCRQILWGLFKKLVIADNCGYLVNNVFNGQTPPTGVAVAVGALVYTIQIYCDFSGYSDIAIGCGKLFGIRCMVNFRFPYFAHNISEFWRRWHISLTTWFRDYLYIPLGGSRTSTGKHIRNIFIVFLASGLWHGANWTFVVWGLYHAILFMPLLLIAKLRPSTGNQQFLPGGG